MYGCLPRLSQKGVTGGSAFLFLLVPWPVVLLGGNQAGDVGGFLVDFAGRLLGRRGGHSFAGRLKNIFKEGVASCEAAQNIVVVKTMPGLAPAAAAALDGMELDGFVGSLAGDDTAILIMRTSRVAEELTQEIESMLEG